MVKMRLIVRKGLCLLNVLIHAIISLTLSLLILNDLPLLILRWHLVVVSPWRMGTRFHHKISRYVILSRKHLIHVQIVRYVIHFMFISSVV